MNLIVKSTDNQSNSTILILLFDNGSDIALHNVNPLENLTIFLQRNKSKRLLYEY